MNKHCVAVYQEMQQVSKTHCTEAELTGEVVWEIQKSLFDIVVSESVTSQLRESPKDLFSSLECSVVDYLYFCK